MELKFHKESFVEQALKQEEPEETLEELMESYESASAAYIEFREAYKKAIEPWRKGSTGIDANDIDYDAWEKGDPKTYWDYAFAGFNGFNAIDMLEDLIDIKICHLNNRNRKENCNFATLSNA